jgi:hypothetical protein
MQLLYLPDFKKEQVSPSRTDRKQNSKTEPTFFIPENNEAAKYLVIINQPLKNGSS